ncbi:MAG: hypothetical protein AB1700_04215 [Bacillota bacterium]
MDVYLGVKKISLHRFRELQPYLEDLKEQGFQETKSPRFKIFLKHPERDDWAVVVKNPRSGEFILVRGGLDVMFGPAEKAKPGCIGCTMPSCNGCPLLRAYAQNPYDIRPGK